MLYKKLSLNVMLFIASHEDRCYQAPEWGGWEEHGRACSCYMPWGRQYLHVPRHTPLPRPLQGDKNN